MFITNPESVPRHIGNHSLLGLAFTFNIGSEALSFKLTFTFHYSKIEMRGSGKFNFPVVDAWANPTGVSVTSSTASSLLSNRLIRSGHSARRP